MDIEHFFMWIGIWAVYKGIRNKIAPHFGLWLYELLVGDAREWEIRSSRNTKIRVAIAKVLYAIF